MSTDNFHLSVHIPAPSGKPAEPAAALPADDPNNFHMSICFGAAPLPPTATAVQAPAAAPSPSRDDSFHMSVLLATPPLQQPVQPAPQRLMSLSNSALELADSAPGSRRSISRPMSASSHSWFDQVAPAAPAPAPPAAASTSSAAPSSRSPARAASKRHSLASASDSHIPRDHSKAGAAPHAQGFLWIKKGMKWHRRWFVLQSDGQLAYYSSRFFSPDNCKGFIALVGASVELAGSAIVFSIRDSGAKKHTLRADSPAARQIWISQLQRFVPRSATDADLSHHPPASVDDPSCLRVDATPKLFADTLPPVAQPAKKKSAAPSWVDY